MGGVLVCSLVSGEPGQAEDSLEGNFRTEVAEIRLEAREGLVFHPARAKAKSGSRLEVHFTNTDPNDIPHNVCLVAPEKLAEIQQASLAIDSSAEARGFVPDHPAALSHTTLIGADETANFSYQLPDGARGIYYLVCTFPGHANIMYSPLYVDLNPRLSVADDPEVSPLVRQKEKARVAALENVDRPSVLRAIMEDTGAASILVALPNDLNYCWDANTCRLRYVWRGAFANPLPHFDGNGSQHPEILGDEFWRSIAGETVFGIGPAGKKIPSPDYLGYDLLEGIPTFRYGIAGVEIHERMIERDGALHWTFHFEGPAVEKEWSVLAPDRETAEISAPGARRDRNRLVFQRTMNQPIEITVRPVLP